MQVSYTIFSTICAQVTDVILIPVVSYLCVFFIIKLNTASYLHKMRKTCFQNYMDFCRVIGE